MMWRPKVNEFVERLQILHDICPAHANICKEFDAVLSVYEARFSPPGQEEDVAEEGNEEDVAEEGNADVAAVEGNASNVAKQQ